MPRAFITISRTARPTVALARKPGPKTLPVQLKPSRRRIGPLTMTSWHWPVVLWSRPVAKLGCIASTAARTTPKYSLRQPAIAAAAAASSTVQTRPRWLTDATSSLGSRPAWSAKARTVSSLTGTTGRPSVQPSW